MVSLAALYTTFAIPMQTPNKEEIKVKILYHIKSATTIPYGCNTSFSYIIKYFNFYHSLGQNTKTDTNICTNDISSHLLMSNVLDINFFCPIFFLLCQIMPLQIGRNM
jgi:hypothetical protein